MHRGRDHDHPHHHDDGAAAGLGHNQTHGRQRAVQWQAPHRGQEDHRGDDGQGEVDLDLVEKAFVTAFADAPDPTSLLRLAQVPFEAMAADGTRLVLLRVETDLVTDIGTVMPHLGGASFRYDPLPAAMVAHRRRLRFVYFDGQTLRPLGLAEARALREPMP
jgi:hypothetical protein